MKHFLLFILCILVTTKPVQASQQKIKELTPKDLAAELATYKWQQAEYLAILQQGIGGTFSTEASRNHNVELEIAEFAQRMRQAQEVRSFFLKMHKPADEKSVWQMNRKILLKLVNNTQKPSLFDTLFREQRLMNREKLEKDLIKKLACAQFAVQEQEKIIKMAQKETAGRV